MDFRKRIIARLNKRAEGENMILAWVPRGKQPIIIDVKENPLRDDIYSYTDYFFQRSAGPVVAKGTIEELKQQIPERVARIKNLEQLDKSKVWTVYDLVKYIKFKIILRGPKRNVYLPDINLEGVEVVGESPRESTGVGMYAEGSPNVIPFSDIKELANNSKIRAFASNFAYRTSEEAKSFGEQRLHDENPYRNEPDNY